MKDQAEKILATGPGDPVWFVSQTHALSKEDSLTQFNREYKELAKYDLKRAIKLDSVAKVPDAYAILYAILHSARFVSGGYTEKGKEKDSSEPAVVEPKSYYETLSVNENATSKEIGFAYNNKLKSFNLNELEKHLRTQGLSDAEIKIRLEQAQKEYEDLREAYTGVGNEQNRKYYDEFRKKYAQDKNQQGQGTSSQRKASPTGNARSYEVLGVSPNPSQIEIRSAYRKLSKELHPDVYLNQLGKRLGELTPEELKEYNIRQEKFIELDLEHKKVFNQQQLSRELTEVREKEKLAKSQEQPQNIVITATPTVPETKASKEALQKTENFRETMKQAGNISFTPEETAELKSIGVVSYTTTSEELSANATIATTQLLPMGIEANKFSQAVDIAVENNILTPKRAYSLHEAAFILEADQHSNPDLTKILTTGNREPNVTITTLDTLPVKPPQQNQIVLQSQNGYFKPLLDEVFGKGLDIAKGKAEKVVVGALEKSGVSVAKSTAQKLTVEALKKGGKELIMKTGSAIAAKLGLTVAFAAATGMTSLIAQAALWIASKLIKPLINFAKKAVSKILQFITGKDDLKSQLKELSGIALILSLITGAVVPAIISGGVFLSVLGVGSIIGGVVGAFHALIFFVIAIVMVISGPFILSAIALIILIIFITFIINNSAFVVPYGGYATIDPYGRPIIPVECSLEKGPVSFSNGGASGIAERAWEITADLYQGFWCYWNRSPDDSATLAELLGEFPPDVVLYPESYPELFDEVAFVRNPNPTRDEMSGDASSMFWCTQLVVISWQETGNYIAVYYNSQDLEDWFRDRGQFISASSANSTNIPPGSIIFFYVYGGPVRTNHVAIAHHIIPNDAVVYVQSNSGFKDGYLSFEDDGTGIINPTWARITGFGTP